MRDESVSVVEPNSSRKPGSARFAELDWSPTPIGEISLRRRQDPVSGVDIFEVKLGDDFLMSSQFTVAEIELARLALARLSGSAFDVAVGGLGLGYTAQAVLADDRVRELVVVELLEPVIRWHQQGLVPVGPMLTADPRCRLVPGDFFAMSDGPGFDPESPGRTFDALIVDIDHAPDHLLAAGSTGFYSPPGTRRLAGAPPTGRRLRPVVQRSTGRGLPGRAVRGLRGGGRRGGPVSQSLAGSRRHQHGLPGHQADRPVRGTAARSWGCSIIVSTPIPPRPLPLPVTERAPGRAG